VLACVYASVSHTNTNTLTLTHIHTHSMPPQVLSDFVVPPSPAVAEV